MSYTGGEDPATLMAGGLLLLIQQENKLRIHLAHNYIPPHTEWRFSQVRMYEISDGDLLKILEIL